MIYDRQKVLKTNDSIHFVYIERARIEYTAQPGAVYVILKEKTKKFL